MVTMGSLPRPFLLLLLSTVSVAELGSVLLETFKEFPDYTSWLGAQMFCRSLNSGTDLATFHTQSDVDVLNIHPNSIWVGLKFGPLNQWTWTNGQALDSTLYMPFVGSNCAYYSFHNQNFISSDCAKSYFFICYKFDNSNNRFTFVNQTMSWEDARQYCRNRFTDLAVSENFTQLAAAVSGQDFPVWTGLHRDGAMWKWSTGKSDYRSWATDQPGNNGDCVAISSVSKMMTTQNCLAQYPFVCIKDNLLLVKQRKTWEEALEYCKAITSYRRPYQLVSLQPGDDFSYVMDTVSEADTEEVWTGLRFLAGDWFWVNGADMLLSDLPSCPPAGHNCGAFSQSNDAGRLEPRDCSEEKNFLCYSQW